MKKQVSSKVEPETDEVVVKRGSELKTIEAWNESQDEIEELKKVFFEFLKRWVGNDGSQLNVNKPTLY